MTKTDGKGTISEGSYHPAADGAMEYIKSIPTVELFMIAESFASTSLSGNKTSEICYETLDRLLKKEPVSDRYLLGLAWTIKRIRDEKG